MQTKDEGVAGRRDRSGPDIGGADKDFQAQWARVRARLREEFGEEKFRSWLSKMTLFEVAGGRVRIGVPTRFLHDWIATHYNDRIRALWMAENPAVTAIEVFVASGSSSAAPAAARTGFAAPHRPAAKAKEVEEPAPAVVAVSSEAGEEKDQLSAPLDPRFTFENFVVGKPNELAHAAARRVAETCVAAVRTAPFNPLFLYGGVGLGKTHLMHAIAWHIRTQTPARKVIYLCAEKFMYQFIRALRFKDTMAFKEQFRSVDVLMIDDVQFICGKDSTQEEFFHTFNALVDQNRQIVISADKSPSDLEGMEERMRSRLGWGLVADIHPTTYELRLGILQAKAEQRKATVPPKVLEFLAHKITSNVRELEGALNRIVAHATLVGRDDHARERPGSAARSAARQRPPRHHRRDPEARRRALQHPPRRHAFGAARPRRRPAAPGGDVPVQAADAALAARDRPQVRRPRPHDRHARRAQDRGAAGDRPHPRRGCRAAAAHAGDVTRNRRLRAAGSAVQSGAFSRKSAG